MANLLSSELFRGYRHPFLFGIHYFGGVGGKPAIDTPKTIADLAMSMFSAEIRRSTEWWKDFENEDVRRKWANSALQRTWRVRAPSSTAEVLLSQKQINYVLDELKGYCELRDEKGRCQVSCFERIWESNTLLDPLAKKSLSASFDKLKPGALKSDDGTITYLLDHMLYPLIYNKTLVSHLSGRFLRSVPPPPSNDVYTVSPIFLLLPSDVSVSEDGSVEFLSYINNLHPDLHHNTCLHLESLLAGFLPLFEHTLTDLHRNNPLVQRIPGRCRYTIWEEPEPPEYSDDEEGWTTYESDMRKWALNRPIDLPDVPDTGYPGRLEARRHVVTLRNRTIQVIVSAFEISLHPQGPIFSGTPWHVEGMRGERIVACGFHCLSADNVKENFFRFRMAVTYPRGFSAGDTGATLRTWGIRDGDSCHQYVGEVPIRSGFSLVFPNIYQHQHTSFGLADPSREGHLTGIWFFLIDPEIRPIISTATVGPQQELWIRNELYQSLDKRLPNELIEKILENVEGLMTPKEAGVYREKLVQATEQFTHANNSYHFCIPFDIWNGPDSTPS